MFDAMKARPAGPQASGNFPVSASHLSVDTGLTDTLLKTKRL